MRVADVADAIVASYLYRVVARLPRESQPSEAWFRVTSGSSRIPLEMGETTPVIDPNFEVAVVTSKTVPGLLTVLTRASAEMDGPIRVLPSAILASDFSSEGYEAKGWKRVPVPNLSEPELLGV
jgi:hypothetical protein